MVAAGAPKTLCVAEAPNIDDCEAGALVAGAEAAANRLTAGADAVVAGACPNILA